MSDIREPSFEDGEFGLSQLMHCIGVLGILEGEVSFANRLVREPIALPGAEYGELDAVEIHVPVDEVTKMRMLRRAAQADKESCGRCRGR